MRNILKKLHIMPNQSEDSIGSVSSRNTSNRGNNNNNDGSTTSKISPSHHTDQQNKAFSGLSGWLNSVTNRHNSSPTPLNVVGGRRGESPIDTLSISALDAALESVGRDSESSNSRDPEVEEEYQVQIALELSAREDPEAVQIEAVKQISLGACHPENTPAEVIAYRYWNYNALGYDDKIMDGFYDLYGILAKSTSEKMPSLVDLQGTPMSDIICREAVLVNRGADANLLKLEQKALVMAVQSRSESLGLVDSELVQKVASLVADYMGGPVGDPDNMLKAWKNLSNRLRENIGSMVLPLGSLTIGLARHRALLFKVLADSVGIPCSLVKGRQSTGSHDVAMNIIRLDDGREYIIDLMAAPGTLIPSDAASPQIECEQPHFPVNPYLRDVDYSQIPSSSSEVTTSVGEYSEFGNLDKMSRSGNVVPTENDLSGTTGGSNELRHTEDLGIGSSQESSHYLIKSEVETKLPNDFTNPVNLEKAIISQDLPNRANYPYTHARSPSWTEGVSSPAARRMKVKDVSQYMIDAAKENPQLAQKLHDVLLESGVIAPPNLFTEVYNEHANAMALDEKKQIEKDNERRRRDGIRRKGQGIFLPPLPYQGTQAKGTPSRAQLEHLKPIEGLGINSPTDSEASASSGQASSPVKFAKQVPVAAAAAAATAAVVASTMVVAAAKSSMDSKLEDPVAAAATATAAVFVATTAAVSRQYEQLEICAQLAGGVSSFNNMDCLRDDENADSAGNETRGSSDRDHDASPEAERVSDRSAGNDSTRSDIALDDVAEWEIPWEDMALGERIGLGSYGEVYRGDWHGTEVAVKKFLDQDISGDALEEFRSEVRIMKRLRHPNVVLFMGAVTRAPNLSIVTEFLPRGSLYRLIHRPNSQVDERRRLRMALDVARGMNYLHSCTPVIVHRDLKSPNLLVDKNWVVKVCDFGLSRIKHNTFLSSRSTAGTAEWMAPEVLRNEPSDEKCDVYSFGVILWELCTMQQPWGGMNPMQVVGAVGFQHRRLDVPDDMDPVVADIIQKCWQTNPKLRPSFAEIMAALKPLQKPITNSQVPRPRSSGQEKVRHSQATEE
ncbi:probable serine/threonine-protein kinase SIS8 isoform X1 [Papaver somniferum]|uniref:probable serine/threonine-protein kinase SIS8 isoform X1 n=1 Tax=Papaver somniferum TaxID=3469 RepID=UPI000E6FDCC4|nr:probable serine/threonine-protein kinase SIS8 isoform X1 [Papaver somniferum]